MMVIKSMLSIVLKLQCEIWINWLIKKLKSLAAQLKIINQAFNIQKLKLSITPLPLLEKQGSENVNTKNFFNS
jgi:hypothetical protein